MEEKPVNKNRTIIIVVVAVIAIACCCVVAGIVGFYSFTNISSVKSSAPQPIESIETIAPPSDINSDEPPIGGLGNDVLRKDTWQVMAPAAVGLGCDQPIGADTKIEVLQQPDAAGYWVEKWTVACSSGDTYAFQVEFTLDATGTTFNIKSLP
jgi:hypothetical protein